MITTDIDIDVKNRDDILDIIPHIPASKWDKELQKFTRHLTGVYCCDIPFDPLTDLATFEYKEAEKLGFMKIDFLNLSVYEHVRDEQHLQKLMNTTPKWQLLEKEDFVKGTHTMQPLFHIGEHFDVVNKIKPTSLEDLAIVIAMIRPAKRYLMWKQRWAIAKEIWEKPEKDEYYFKKAHAFSYAMAIIVHMNSIYERNRELIYNKYGI